MAKRDEQVVRSLRTWNLVLAGLFVVQGIIFVLGSSSRSYPMSANFLTLDPLQTAAQSKSVLTPALHHLFDINLMYLVGAVLLVAALMRLLVATRWRSGYESALQARANPYRWSELLITNGLLLVVIAMLAGVQDVALLLAVFGLNALASLGWWLAEVRRKPRETAGRPNYVLASVAAGLAWLVPLLYLLAGAVYGHAAAASTWWIFGTMLVLSAAVPVALTLSVRKNGAWHEYFFTERTYQLLQLATLSLLTWQLFAGVLKP
jgi:hypothetical protein